MSRLLLPHHIERRSPARVRRDAGRALDRSAIVASLFPIAVITAMAFLLTGCIDQEVSRKVDESAAYVEASTATCDKGPGYCYECGMGFNGFKCDFSYKYSCSGRQPVTARFTPYVATLESGKTETGQIVKVLSIDGECK